MLVVDYIRGMQPTQAEGTIDDGYRFYFRARHGEWRLRIVTSGANAASDRSLLELGGDDPTHGCMEWEEVMAILGKGWRQFREMMKEKYGNCPA